MGAFRRPHLTETSHSVTKHAHTQSTLSHEPHSATNRFFSSVDLDCVPPEGYTTDPMSREGLLGPWLYTSREVHDREVAASWDPSTSIVYLWGGTRPALSEKERPPGSRLHTSGEVHDQPVRGTRTVGPRLCIPRELSGRACSASPTLSDGFWTDGGLSEASFDRNESLSHRPLSLTTLTHNHPHPQRPSPTNNPHPQTTPSTLTATPARPPLAGREEAFHFSGSGMRALRWKMSSVARAERVPS